MFVVTLAFWLAAVAIYASYAYDTVLSCDREADVCTVTAFHHYWVDERDRFRASDFVSAKIVQPADGTRSDSCLVFTLKRAGAVEICEPGAWQPDFVADVQRYFSDRTQPSLRATLSGAIRGYMGIAIMVVTSLPFLAYSVLGLWTRIGPRTKAQPTGREGIGSRR